ncbi:1-acyl-sn-glycerol-3-phosphate acyltransferase, partial [bacterium]|nr:1-acyl-sn-glycerol-3-phosphate acyltransferase [bacterium]
FCVETNLYGVKKLPPPPYILASNHNSLFDPMFIFSKFPEKVYYIAKYEIFQLPFIGNGIMEAGHIKLNREYPGFSFIKQSVQYFNEKKVVGLFIEGTRLEEGERGEGKVGSGMLISFASVPIVPFFIDNSAKLVKKGKWVPNMGFPINGYIGKTIFPDEIESWHDKSLRKKEYYKSISSNIIDRIYQIKEKEY